MEVNPERMANKQYNNPFSKTRVQILIMTAYNTSCAQVSKQGNVIGLLGVSVYVYMYIIIKINCIHIYLK